MGEYYGEIIIDPAAAEADVKCINQAIEILYSSLNSLKSVSNTASSIQGETGIAIVEKSNQMVNRINELIRQLQETTSLIDKVVNEYYERQRNLINQYTST